MKALYHEPWNLWNAIGMTVYTHLDDVTSKLYQNLERKMEVRMRLR